MKRTVEEWQNRVNELRMIGEWQLWERRIMELRGWITKNGRHIFIGDSGKGGGGVDKSPKSGIIKTDDKFHSISDPMYEVTGRAIDSNPKEINQMEHQLEAWGVEINRGANTLGYGCTSSGKPGVMSITDDASYSAWCHEFDHAKEDMKAGWNGLEVLWTNPQERIRREEHAYAIEIKLANDAGRSDVAKQLEDNLNDEIQKIKTAFPEYF